MGQILSFGPLASLACAWVGNSQSGHGQRRHDAHSRAPAVGFMANVSLTLSLFCCLQGKLCCLRLFLWGH